jgi:hypothetical protein
VAQVIILLLPTLWGRSRHQVELLHQQPEQLIVPQTPPSTGLQPDPLHPLGVQIRLFSLLPTLLLRLVPHFHQSLPGIQILSHGRLGQRGALEGSQTLLLLLRAVRLNSLLAVQAVRLRSQLRTLAPRRHPALLHYKHQERLNPLPITQPMMLQSPFSTLVLQQYILPLPWESQAHHSLPPGTRVTMLQGQLLILVLQLCSSPLPWESQAC